MKISWEKGIRNGDKALFLLSALKEVEVGPFLFATDISLPRAWLEPPPRFARAGSQGSRYSRRSQMSSAPIHSRF